jgi:hypothetical protein
MSLSPMAKVIALAPRPVQPRSHVTPHAQAVAAGHPSAWPYDRTVDELGLDARKFAIEALVGFAATSEALAMREAAGVVDALLRRGELVLFGPDDADPTPPHGIVRPL